MDLCIWNSKTGGRWKCAAVVSRILASREDIMKAKVRTAIETALEEVIQKIVRETLIRD